MNRIDIPCALRALIVATVILPMAMSSSCSCEPPKLPGEIAGDGFAAVIPVDERTLVLSFSEPVDPATVHKGAFAIGNFTVVPPATVGVDSASATGEAEATVKTSTALLPGVGYTLVVSGVKGQNGRDLSGTLNFIAAGEGNTVQVRIIISDVETARRHEELALLATVGDDGAFSEELVAWPVIDDGASFIAVLPARVDPARTLDSGDDADPIVDRRSYAVLLVDGAGRMASALTRFVVQQETAVDVPITILPPLEIIDRPPTDPLPPPPEDENVGDGKKVVRIAIDDRAARELRSPQLKLSFTADGAFDVTFPQTVELIPLDGDFAGYWSADVTVAVDATRVEDGNTNETFPYFAYLVNDGTPYEGLSVAVVAPDETPQTVRLSLGRADWTPVTFRVDASRAYVNASGSQRGVLPDESVFLTGEWREAVDALGNNCGDGFTGGEQAALQMRELEDHAGVWQRTVWLPPGRPYGWKVVRCTTGDGCGELNQFVAAEGRVFATVMKNLATDNTDAFADPDVGIVDPVNPAQTEAGGQIRDYSNATVYAGTGVGSEPDPAGTPDGARMFKQEVPDLVVVVGAVPIRTRVVHVGTWRDVNLGQSPQEIIDAQTTVQLTPFDYDDGFIGRFPPSREEP